MALNLVVQSVAEKGNIDKERLVLRAKSAINLGDYLLMRTGFQDGEVTIGVRDTYWFPYETIKENDLVVLYTKSGKINAKEISEGRSAHFFYLGKSEAIWTGNNAAVVLHAPNWESTAPSDL